MVDDARRQDEEVQDENPVVAHRISLQVRFSVSPVTRVRLCRRPGHSGNKSPPRAREGTVRMETAVLQSASRPSSFFLANPSLSRTSPIDRIGCCWLWMSQFCSWQGQFWGQWRSWTGTGTSRSPSARTRCKADDHQGSKDGKPGADDISSRRRLTLDHHSHTSDAAM